jgi:hypothetical protein
MILKTARLSRATDIGARPAECASRRLLGSRAATATGRLFRLRAGWHSVRVHATLDPNAPGELTLGG